MSFINTLTTFKKMKPDALVREVFVFLEFYDKILIYLNDGQIPINSAVSFPYPASCSEENSQRDSSNAHASYYVILF